MDHDRPDLSDDEAFERFVVPELAVLTRVARSLTRRPADAEDVVQDTLLRAYRAIGRFDGRHPRAWLLTILRNAHANQNRGTCPSLLPDPETSQALLERNGSHIDVAEVVVGPAIEPRVEAAVARLPYTFRQVIELVDLNGLSYREAAAALGVPPGTVMSRLHRARQRVRVQIELPDRYE